MKMGLDATVDLEPDSLEIGTPAKGGGVKVYGSFSRLEEFKAKIDAALEARAYAQQKLASMGGL